MPGAMATTSSKAPELMDELAHRMLQCGAPAQGLHGIPQELQGKWPQEEIDVDLVLLAVLPGCA